MNKKLLIIFSAILILYSACKKDAPALATSKGTTSPDYKAMSSQMIKQISQSLNGNLSYAGVNQGTKLPFNATDGKFKTLAMNFVSSLCGTVKDTAVNTNNGKFPLGQDTLKKHFEYTQFTYTCDIGQVNGYLLTDSLVNIDNYNFTTFDTYASTQHYSVKALDQTYKLVSLNGTLNSSDLLIDDEQLRADTTTQAYNLSGLKIDFNSGTGDVISGTATFKIHVETFGIPNLREVVSNTYFGTIEYIGNHKAKVTFNPGGSYIVDLVTGAATPL